jgi:hypothetical protein
VSFDTKFAKRREFFGIQGENRRSPDVRKNQPPYFSAGCLIRDCKYNTVTAGCIGEVSRAIGNGATGQALADHAKDFQFAVGELIDGIVRRVTTAQG